MSIHCTESLKANKSKEAGLEKLDTDCDYLSTKDDIDAGWKDGQVNKDRQIGRQISR